jgi:hypothetical protein
VPGERGCRCPELHTDTPGDHCRPTAKSSPVPGFLHCCAEDWPEEGLAALEPIHALETLTTDNRIGVAPAEMPPTVLAPKPQVLAAIADAQPVDFSAMAALQQSCPKVAEMLTSGNLQITSQTVGEPP